MHDAEMKNDRVEVRELLCMIRQGDQAAFGRLYARYLPLIGRLVSGFSSHFLCEEDADDFRQEAALALYQAALAYRLEQSEVEFGLFAKVCMKNRMIDKLRVLDRLGRTEVFDEAGEDSGYLSAADPAARILDAEAVASINAVIDGSLSVYERRVLKWYLSGYSACEIAKSEAKDEKSVTNAIYRIKRKLRKILQS